MALGPNIDVGPVGGILFWLLLGLVVIGFVLSATMSGLLVWVIGAVLIVGLLWVLSRRFLGRMTGRRR